MLHHSSWLLRWTRGAEGPLEASRRSWEVGGDRCIQPGGQRGLGGQPVEAEAGEKRRAVGRKLAGQCVRVGRTRLCVQKE